MYGITLEAVTRDDFLEWRDRLLEGRQPRTVNRHARAVAAALNQAVELGYLGNPAAWRLKALSDDIEEGGETAVFLDAAHRRAVIAARLLRRRFSSADSSSPGLARKSWRTP
jgi:hypothetical protein